MANFCSYPKETRITEVSLPNALDSGAKSTVIGLWGFLDFDEVELSVLSPPYVSVKKGVIKGKVRLYDISSYHPGTWTLEAVTRSGSTWDTLTVSVPPRKDSLGPWSGDSSLWPQAKKLQSMHPDLRSMVEDVLDALAQRGFKPKIVYGWRSVAVQLKLFNQGHSKVKFSFHNAQKPDGTPNAYAADIVDSRYNWKPEAKTSGFWDALGEEAKSRGLYWGGDWASFRDWAHVQLVPNSQLARVKQESGL
jgi:peptidoglycan L-alanyl-D-glutamate endopeptidase CwlK